MQPIIGEGGDIGNWVGCGYDLHDNAALESDRAEISKLVEKESAK
jgi:hypothetical protein